MSLSDNKKLLLLKGVKNKGIIKTRTAQGIYSSNNSARSALNSLMLKGYIVHKKVDGVPINGVFKIKKLPEEIKDRYREWKESKETKKA